MSTRARQLAACCLALGLAGCHLLLPLGAKTDAAAPTGEGPRPREQAIGESPPDGHREGPPVAGTWARQFESPGLSRGAVVAVDPAGGPVVAGLFSDRITFDPGGPYHLHQGGDDVFVAGLSSSGQLRWGITFGGTSHEGVHGLQIDPSGQALVVGYFSTPLIFPGGEQLASLGGADGFLVTLKGGSVVARQAIATASDDMVRAVAVDPAGGTFIAGHSMGSLNLGPSCISGGLGQRVFAARLEGSSCKWLAESAGGPASPTAAAYSPAAGALFLTGQFTTGLTFAPLAPRSGGGGGQPDLFVAGLDATSGQGRWLAVAGSGAFDEGEAVAVDAKGNVYVTGTVSAQADFHCGAPPALGMRDVFVAKYPPASGPCLWVKRFGSSTANSTSAGHAIAISENGDLFVAGDCTGDVDFGGIATKGYAPGRPEAFLLSLRPDGTVTSAKRFGGSAVGCTASARGVALDAQRIYLTGEFTQQLVVGEVQLQGGPTNRAFLAGIPRW